MKINLNSMKFAAAALALLLVASFGAGPAVAQSSMPTHTGRVIFDAPVQWGDAKLPAGEYTVSLQSSSLPALVIVRNDKTGAIIQARAFRRTTDGSEDSLIVVSQDGTNYVRSLSLGSAGILLEYKTPQFNPDATRTAENVKKVPVRPLKNAGK